MKKLFETGVASIITFFLAITLNGLSEYFSVKDGNVRVGPSILVNQKLFLPLEVDNYSGKQISGLQLQVPKFIKPDQVAASAPIRISSVPNIILAGDVTRIDLSLFPPHQSVTLLIPVNNEAEAASIRSINADELKLNLSPTSDLRPPAMLDKYIVPSLISALVVGIASFLILVRLDGLKEKLEKAEQRMDVLSERFSEKENAWRKMKILALARITDYSKELSFWRDVVRRILHNSSDKKNADKVIDEVTASLQTYGTRKDSREFETILVMSRIFSGAEPGVIPSPNDGV